MKFLTACTLLVETLVVMYEEKESLNTVLIEKLDTIYYMLNPSITVQKSIFMLYISQPIQRGKMADFLGYI